MIGDKVVEGERGKIVGSRVLPSGGGVELTFQTTGKILGLDFKNLGTVVSKPKPGGVLYAEGQGIVTTSGGDMAMWTFQGVVTPSGPLPAGSFRGSVFFETASERLARLNTTCALVEAEADAEGNLRAELWEWR